jgi:hypothetical protein
MRVEVRVMCAFVVAPSYFASACVEVWSVPAGRAQT